MRKKTKSGNRSILIPMYPDQKTYRPCKFILDAHWEILTKK